jgi:hypothetical protein
VTLDSGIPDQRDSRKDSPPYRVHESRLTFPLTVETPRCFTNFDSFNRFNFDTFDFDSIFD